MKFCPNCRYEYHELMTRCSTCGAELVAALPPPLPKERRGIPRGVASVGGWIYGFFARETPRTFRESWTAFRRALRSKYVLALVVAVTVVNAAGEVLSGTVTSRGVATMTKGSLGSPSPRVSPHWPGATRFTTTPTMIESWTTWLSYLWWWDEIVAGHWPMGFDSASKGPSQRLRVWWGVCGSIAFLVIVLDTLLLAPWLVWLQESLTGTASAWPTWKRSIGHHGVKLALWLIALSVWLTLYSLSLSLLIPRLPMLLGDRSALFYLVTGRFPPVVTLARGGWSALFHLVIAATCLVPAVIVVQGGSLPHCVWQALRLCKRRMASLLVLYGGYWLVGHAVQWLSSLHSDLPTFGYGDGPAGFWGPVGPLQWAWVILFGVIGWQVIHLWLSATFMALVLEEPGEEQGE